MLALDLGQAGVWSAAECESSLRANGIYEAVGLALWLRTGALGLQVSEDINWHSLSYFKDAFFSKRAVYKAVVSRVSAGTKRVKGQRSRLLWPMVMICAVDAIPVATQASFDASLPLLHTGQFVLWAWYLAVYEAIKAADIWLN